MQWWLVEVEHDGDTCHEEQEEHHPELLNAALAGKCLPQQADDAEQQRQAVERVVSLVFLAIFSRKQLLVAKAGVVQEVETGNPVATGHIAHFAVQALHIVLATCEVPQEVAHIHVVELITQEELDIVEERWLWKHLLRLVESGIGVAVLIHNDGGEGFAEWLVLGVEICVVVVCMGSRPDAREQHIHFAWIYRIFCVASAHILVRLVSRGLHHTRPLLGAFLEASGSHALAVALVLWRAGGIYRAVEQWGFAILVTAQVAVERKHIVGRVFVQWQVGA